MSKITKKAFTMAEVLMVLAVLGIIAAILIPSIAAMKPDQNRVMFKKAYYLTERLISEIVNDEELYTSGDGSEVGFLRMGSAKIVELNGDETPRQVMEKNVWVNVGDDSNTLLQAKKLCLLFMDRLNLTTDDANTTACGSTNNFGGNPNFKTVDGIWWYFPANNNTSSLASNATANGGRWVSTSSDKLPEKIIRVDTNGDKRPNCRCTSVNANNICTSSPSCKKPDRFEIIVRSDGKMRVIGPKEIEYLRAASAVNDK